MENEKSYVCQDCEDPHIILPEGVYLPPNNDELYEMVRGRKVLIIIGTVNAE